MVQHIGVEQFHDKTTFPHFLEAGLDYPRFYREFVEWFPDDEACLIYLEKLRWPNRFICPACHLIGKPWRQTRGRMVCSSCRHQTSVTSRTIFDKTRTPLTTWLEIAWHMTTVKNGLSAKTVQRTLGPSYRTAWNPSGLCLPLAFGIKTRLMSELRYCLFRSSSSNRLIFSGKWL